MISAAGGCKKDEFAACEMRGKGGREWGDTQKRLFLAQCRPTAREMMICDFMREERGEMARPRPETYAELITKCFSGSIATFF